MFASSNSREKYRKQIKAKRKQNESSQTISLQHTISKEPRSLATRRLRNITTILHLSLLRRDIPRAERSFALLLRSEKHGVSLNTLWELGLEILIRSTRVSATAAEEFLGRARLTSSDIGHHPTAQKHMIALFSALVVLMIRKGKIKQALGEVNDSLLDWPYSDEPKIRTYAKMLAESYEAMQREEERTGNTTEMSRTLT